MTVKINDNSIFILNHRITLDDMINEIYYMFNIAHCNEPSVADIIYLSQLNQEDKDRFHQFREQKLYDIATISHYKKPIFNNNINYKLKNNKIYCLAKNTLIEEYNDINCINCINDIMIHINIFYKTLKFKIKQERITRNIYKDLHISNKKIIDLEQSFYNMTKALKSQDKVIYKLCNIVEEKHITFDITLNKHIDTVEKFYKLSRIDINYIKKREIYLILFVIITTFINFMISYKMI
jgi:hypothetical protein